MNLISPSPLSATPTVSPRDGVASVDTSLLKTRCWSLASAIRTSTPPSRTAKPANGMRPSRNIRYASSSRSVTIASCNAPASTLNRMRDPPCFSRAFSALAAIAARILSTSCASSGVGARGARYRRQCCGREDESDDKPCRLGPLVHGHGALSSGSTVPANFSAAVFSQRHAARLYLIGHLS